MKDILPVRPMMRRCQECKLNFVPNRDHDLGHHDLGAWARRIYCSPKCNNTFNARRKYRRDNPIPVYHPPYIHNTKKAPRLDLKKLSSSEAHNLFERVKRLYEQTKSTTLVERVTGVEQSLVWRWTHGKKPQNFVNEFDVSNLESLAYLIGALWGDGTIYSHHKNDGYFTFRLEAKDRDFVEATQKAVRLIFPQRRIRLFITNRKNGKHYFAIKVGCTAFKNWLDQQNITVFAMKHPSSFVRGFADSEGSVNATRRLLTIHNTDLAKIMFTKSCLDNLGIPSHIYSRISGPSALIPTQVLVHRISIGRISALKTYLEKVGFEIGRKHSALIRAIEGSEAREYSRLYYYKHEAPMMKMRYRQEVVINQ